MKKIFKVFIWILVCAIVGAFISWYSSNYFATPKELLAPVNVRQDSPQYKFINPLLFIKTKKELFAKEFSQFNELISTYIAQAEDKKQADSISVYFNDLNTSHWTGVNEDEKYEPGSMMKVAVLVSYLKNSMKDPSLLSDELYYAGYDSTGQYFKPKEVLKKGYYPINKLLEVMITESDNVAMATLVNNNLPGFRSVYKDFRLPAPPMSDISTDYMSARSYSFIFRILFNSTYLPWNQSEAILDLLSKTAFKGGIVAGVATSTVVAHKFGEHTYVNDLGGTSSIELHDCGIVYYPEHPYLLCVMTKGHSFEDLERVISDISRLVYDYKAKNPGK